MSARSASWSDSPSADPRADATRTRGALPQGATQWATQATDPGSSTGAGRRRDEQASCRSHTSGKGAPHVRPDRKLSRRHGGPAVHGPGHPRGGTRGAACAHHGHPLARPQSLSPTHSQGVQLAVIQELARYWATEYDWRRCEARLSALPHFMTEIDGLDIHFIHVRSRARERAAGHHHARVARLGHRTAERSSTRSPTPPPTARARGRLRRGDPVDAGLRVLRQAAGDRLGP